jgi:hypothetical protein
LEAQDTETTEIALSKEGKPRSLAAERMRRSRERRRNRMRCLTVELRETEVAELIKKGLLNADARNDPHAVRNALHRFFDNTLNPPV